MKPDWREYEAMEKAILKLEAALAERDKRIMELEAAITEIVNISRREIISKDDYQKNFFDLNRMIYKAGTLVEAGR